MSPKVLPTEVFGVFFSDQDFDCVRSIEISVSKFCAF